MTHAQREHKKKERIQMKIKGREIISYVIPYNL